MQVKWYNKKKNRGAERSDRMKCDWCDGEFSPARTWQRFCCPKCRNDWNNREKLRCQIAAAEEARGGRINGRAGGSEEKIDLAQLGLTGPTQPIKRRAVL